MSPDDFSDAEVVEFLNALHELIGRAEVGPD